MKKGHTFAFIEESSKEVMMLWKQDDRFPDI